MSINRWKKLHIIYEYRWRSEPASLHLWQPAVLKLLTQNRRSLRTVSAIFFRIMKKKNLNRVVIIQESIGIVICNDSYHVRSSRIFGRSTIKFQLQRFRCILSWFIRSFWWIASSSFCSAWSVFFFQQHAIQQAVSFPACMEITGATFILFDLEEKNQHVYAIPCVY